MSSIVKVDTIQENTSANGITVDGLNIKDSKLVTADSVVTNNITDANITTDKILDDNVTYAKIQNVSATDRILGRDSSGAGVIEEITPANLRTMLNVADGANAYTHPNHSGEVTSTADGATVIVDNIVDEANLKVSNSPSNGYFLSAQSGNTGGLTWAEAGGGTTALLHSNVLSSNTGTTGVDVNGFFTTDYKIYKLYVYNFSLAGGVEGAFKVISGGSRNGSDYRYIVSSQQMDSGGSVSGYIYGSGGGSQIELSSNNVDWGGGATGRSFVEITLYDPLNTTMYKNIHVLSGNNSNNNSVFVGQTFAEWRNTAAITGIGIYGQGAGIYDKTEFKLYGIKT